jgi:hypothetical protein
MSKFLFRGLKEEWPPRDVLLHYIETVIVNLFLVSQIVFRGGGGLSLIWYVSL